MSLENRIDLNLSDDEKYESKTKKHDVRLDSLKAEKKHQLRFKHIKKDSRFYRVLGIIIMVFSIYLFFSILSYFYTWKEDQSEISRGFLNVLFSKTHIQNRMGIFGAFLANWLVFKTFGVLSISLCSTLAIIGSNLFFQTTRFSLWKNLRYVVFILFFGSGLLSFFTPDDSFNWGGSIGYFFSQSLGRYIGYWGSFLFYIGGLIAYLTWVLGIKWKLPKWREKTKTLMRILFGEKDLYQEEEAAESQVNVDLEPDVSEKSIDDSNSNTAENTIEIVPKPKQESAEVGDNPNFHIVETENKQSSFNPETNVKYPKLYDPKKDLSSYKYPMTNLLKNYGKDRVQQNSEELERNKNQIVSTLKNYDIGIDKIFATIGPTVTLYEIVPKAGIRISKIKNLEDDIALSLSALGIRIIAPIPGKGTIGIEVPNQNRTMVGMKRLIDSEDFIKCKYLLPIAIGKTIDNKNYVVDLASMPHLLMAGATGQGKSVGINAILTSLLFKCHPAELKFVLIDPKKVELSIYNSIEKHFLAKLPGEEEAIITDTKKVVYSLNALCIEMDNRYELLKKAGTRNISEYNDKFLKRKLNPEKGHQFLPFIVLVIDEFADMIMTAGKEVEMPIGRLAQLARAVGIHLIIATQRPSVNIITGTIKANFPARMAFKVSSKIDSRTILDVGGADQLIGKGDMLVSYGGNITRVQCAFIDTDEVENIANYIGYQQGYADTFYLPEYEDEKNGDSDTISDDEKDVLLEEAARLIVSSQTGSTSFIQRKMKLGYNRAGRIMDQLEMLGIVGPSKGSKAREVIISNEDDLNLLL